jgi:hypothetical protein
MTSDLDLLVTRAQAAGVQRVYKINAVPPDTTPAVAEAYMVLSLDTGVPTQRRKSGDTASKTRRLSVQCFGTSDDAVKDMALRADAAFYDQTLTELTGSPFSVRELSTGPYRDPDITGLLTILHVYRF